VCQTSARFGNGIGSPVGIYASVADDPVGMLPDSGTDGAVRSLIIRVEKGSAKPPWRDDHRHINVFAVEEAQQVALGSHREERPHRIGIALERGPEMNVYIDDHGLLP